MISRELLSEVLKEDLHRIGRIDQVANCIHYKIYNDFLEDTYYAVNIYELAHKCKEWAGDKGYILLSKDKECLIYSIDEVYDVVECLNQYEEYFEADTEPEAIFKATSYIMEQLKQKD